MKSSKPSKKTSRNRHQEKHLTTSTQLQTDIYSRVTNKILADLQKGNLTWRQPWSSDHMAGQVTRPLRWNNIPYTGINTILLWATAAELGYGLPHWMTFKQAIELKGNVRKAEKGTQIVYADNLIKKQEDENGEELLQKIPYLKAYTVFNVSQIDGLPTHFYQQPENQRQKSNNAIQSWTFSLHRPRQISTPALRHLTLKVRTAFKCLLLRAFTQLTITMQR